MKSVLVGILLAMSSYAFSSNAFSSEVSTLKYVNYLTIEGMCENGVRIGHHRSNCIQWLKIDYNTRTGRIMLTDMPLYANVNFNYQDVIVEIDYFGSTQQLVFLQMNDGNLRDPSGMIWYLESH